MLKKINQTTHKNKKIKKIKAKDCKCCLCGKQAVCFWPMIDPDIQEHPYCRKCVDKEKMKVIRRLCEKRIR
jgi:hypothetical protein